MNLRRSPECSACPTVAPTCANCLIVSRICWSRMRRSVTTMIESKTGASSLLEADELVREPGDRVRLAAAGRVLDQVAPARAVLARRRRAACARRRAGGSAGRSAPRFFRPVFSSFVLDDLGVVLEDVGQAVAGEDALPEVVGLEPVRVRRIAGAVVPALVERQEPRAPCPSAACRSAPRARPRRSATTQRPNSKSFSRGSRSRLYCSTASSTVCLVRLFFSSKVATGRPLMNRPRSSARCVSSRL